MLTASNDSKFKCKRHTWKVWTCSLTSYRGISYLSKTCLSCQEEGKCFDKNIIETLWFNSPYIY